MDVDDKLDAERQKLSLPPGKVAVICNCVTIERDCYDIFIIDLNSKSHDDVADEFIRVPPTVRVRRIDDLLCFCILGSTVYMIESNHYGNDPPRKSVYAIDLSSYLHDDDVVTGADLKILEKNELGKAPDMLHPKGTPYATPTPDGKMLVLSSVITQDILTKISGEHDFELYDPDTRSWTELPGIHYDWNKHNHHHSYCPDSFISAFTFIGESTFLVETVTPTTIGAFTKSMFAIDLESPGNGWKKWETFYGAMSTECNDCPFLVIEEGLCLTTYGACDITKRDREYPDWYRFPRPPYGVQHEDFGSTFAILLLDDVKKNGNCNFCFLESGLDQQTNYPHLTVIAYHCDVDKYREDKRKKGDYVELRTCITEVRCFKFLLDIEKCTSFSPYDFFSIQERTN